MSLPPRLMILGRTGRGGLPNQRARGALGKPLRAVITTPHNLARTAAESGRVRTLLPPSRSLAPVVELAYTAAFQAAVL